MSVYEKQNLSS
uniref:Uncharacterized protein n=1 Tax=Arundo donax TaxID=35708 RepID=A0A0A8YA88_ARUDO